MGQSHSAVTFPPSPSSVAEDISTKHHSSEKLSTGSPRHMAASQALMATWAPSAKHTGDESTMGQSHSAVTFPPSS